MAARIETHPSVLHAQQSIDRAKKTVRQCELDLGTAERALKRGFESQVDAYATGKDVRNPEGKCRKPPTLSTLQGHVTDCQMKLIAAQQVLRQAKADYAKAIELARGDLAKQYRQQYAEAVQALDTALTRAAKANDKVLQTYEDAREDLGNPGIDSLAWRELRAEQSLAASRLSDWQRAAEEYLTAS